MLEPNADAAVREQAQSLALTAGPGAGKTELLAQRTDFLLRTNTSSFPRRILAISFKVDASRNLADRVRLRCGSTFAMRLDSRTFHAFAKRLLDRNRLALQSSYPLKADFTIGDTSNPPDQITFSQMIPLATKILSTSTYARNALRQAYSHVLLDEFQDCTQQQYDLIKEAFLGSSCTLTAVGDTKQRIMGFAGAMEGVFEQFVTDFDARALNMYQNHRSAVRIRRVHNLMVELMEPEAALPVAVLAGVDGEVRAPSFANSDDEADALVRDIRSRIELGVAPSEIAVIVPREPHLYLAELMRLLEAHGVPYRNEQAQQDLISEPLFTLISDFLLVVLTKRAPDSYSRLMGALIETELDEESEYSTRDRWDRYIKGWRARFDPEGSADFETVRRAVHLFLKRFGGPATRALSPSYEFGDFLNRTYGKIVDMLEAGFTGEGTYAACAAAFGAQEAVRILTVHKSKGLEFETVYVIGAEQSFYPDDETGRCTFFVAISRAKHSLVVTTAGQRPAPSDLPPYRTRRWDASPRVNQRFLDFVESEVDDDEDGGDSKA
ncbi:UvrD-helicase domain-containing protein [Actinomycetospora sp. C-140]